MRFLELQLRAVGPFTGVSLDLSAGERGLHVVYGPNEAGKSSTLRALRYLLFGFPNTVDDDFLHRYQDLRVGAVLESDTGERLEIVRRKALKQPLRGGDDQTVVSDAELRRFLGDVDPAQFPTQFETFFGLDHQALVDGGRSIIEGTGDAGEILFSAGGVAGLQRVLKSLDEECAKLFAPRAQNPEINRLLAGHREAEGEVKSLQLPASDWEGHRKALDEALARKKELETALGESRKARARLDRIQKGVRLVPERDRWHAERVRFADATLLPPDFRDRRHELEQGIAIQKDHRRVAREAVERVEAQLADVHPPEPLLVQREAIMSIATRLGEFQRAASDRPDREREWREFEGQAQAGLRALDRELSLEEAAAVRLPDALRNRVRALAARYETLSGQEQTLAERVAGLARQLDEARRRLETLPPERDVSALHAAVQAALRDGDLEGQLDAARQELVREERQHEADVGRISLWTGTFAEFLALRVPASETVERMHDELHAVHQDIESLSERIAERQTELDRAARDLETLQRAMDVPTEADLEGLRRERDEAWVRLRARIDGRTDATDATDEPAELPEEFRELMLAADGTADRLRREADHVFRRASAEAAVSRLEQEIERLSRERDAHAARRESLDEEWRRLWVPAGMDPRSPHEMLAFLSKHQAIVQRHQGLDHLRVRIESLERRLVSQQALLQRRLRETGDPRPRDLGSETPGELLALAERELALARAAADERAEAARDVRRLEHDLDGPGGARLGLAGVEAERAKWRRDWEKAVADLPFHPGVSPAAVTADVDRITQVQQSLRLAEDRQIRVRMIDAACRQFAADVQSLSAAIDPALAKLPVDQAAVELHARLTQALQAEERVRVLRQKRDEELRREEDAARALAELELKRDMLVREAGCAAPEELPAAEQRSDERRRAEEKLEECEARLRELCAGSPFDEFLDECRQSDGDAVLAEIARLDGEIAADTRALTDEVSVRIGTEQHALAQIDSSGKAVEARERAQDLAARIAAEVEEFARLRLSRIVLARGIERYRERHQGPIIARSAELFRQLTCGKFSGLRQDFDDDGRPVLVGLRAGGNPVRVNAMSDGTADQLFLAIRLAWIEDYLAHHEAVPVTVDDVLIRFDDDRAAETLKVLADLSRKTQVLVFTHHRHLVELAQEILPETAFPHELPAARRKGETAA